ncbi:TIGR04283 family arsenosugar biosynthesis glycosyltransferase [Bradyrhizobium sp.]|uniref:TIGR04283 family arsenosugar biosynthesis glycosyltransferase n=1 Tax=Bradyrhizobium sp. TaxID=376 RepID=UPI002386AC01|nr:TIGR04283 family arsenosugar biosynthesis glycosyltransferase [Bradyrhizobium sp.]MDE1933531.1 TIGR04283 family arsenosugar biosynthesis glycosyltransferase [Bradyrhizobium sp.]
MLSIIIPALNEEETIQSCLKRLQPLRDLGAEVIVVDGGSEDRTVPLARGLADAVIEAPRGRASQMNAGARRARGARLLFLHADTVLPKNALEEIDSALDGARHVWGRFDVRFDSPLRILSVVAFLMNRRSRYTGIATGDQAIFVERVAFERVGGYPNIALMEDIALSSALKHVTRPICVRSKVTTSGRRWELNGPIRTILLMWRLRLAFFFGADPSHLAIEYMYAQRNW